MSGADGSLVETANEVRLPVDATAEFVIDSPDVIHSFWIPALGGKMDAIPGRTNVLRLTPTKIGTYRGVCAEFCGPSHALMAFTVEVQAAGGLCGVARCPGRSRERRREPSSPAPGAAPATSVRGVSEQGSVGPDLTHFASRPTIAAGTLPNTPDNLRAWLVSPSGRQARRAHAELCDAARGRTRRARRLSHGASLMARDDSPKAQASGSRPRGHTRKAGAISPTSTTRSSASGTSPPPSPSCCSAACWR